MLPKNQFLPKPLPSFAALVARPIEEHARLLMRWRNELETRLASIHTEETPWEVFWPRYQERLDLLPDIPPFFVTQGGEPVAYVSFRPYAETTPLRKVCEISVVVDPEKRKKGIGTASLQLAHDWLVRHGYDNVYAEVKRENHPSHRLFQKAGYVDVGEGVHPIPETGEKVPIRLYRKAITPPSLRQGGGVYIVAEAGSNWKGGSAQEDRARAEELIDAAAEAGADAVKFQVFRPETIYAPFAGKADYLEESGVGDNMEALFAHLAMPYEMIAPLASFCEKQKIDFLASVFSPDDFAAVDPYVRLHKLASYEIGHLRLLERMAQSGKPLILSTGAATPEEIDWAVTTFFQKGGKDLFLLQCTAKYPAPLSSLDLTTIPWLKKRFGTGVGLSDHSREVLQGPLGAVALGAMVIEKHYTIDRRLAGPDHAYAIEPHEFKEMVREVRLLEEALGPGWKRVHPVEEELRSFARRGVQALHDIAEGEILQEGGNIAILRPGKQPLGVHPKHLVEIEGRPLQHRRRAGEGIQYGDW